jgi:hypothetical protein
MFKRMIGSSRIEIKKFNWISPSISRTMGSNLSRYHFDRYVKGIMGETQNKGNEYDLTMSCRFGAIECLRWRLRQ